MRSFDMFLTPHFFFVANTLGVGWYTVAVLLWQLHCCGVYALAVTL